MIYNWDTVLHAKTIITQNPGREVLRDHSIAIKDGLFAAIAPTSSIKDAWKADSEFHYANHVIMPGLINSHTHAAMTFLRGLGDDLCLMDWLQRHIFPLESKLTPEIVEMGTMLGYAEMLSTGTTGCIDMYIFESAVFRAAEKTGIRCMGGEAIFEFPSAAFGDYKDALENTALLAEKYSGHRAIKVAVNPHSVYTTTPEILKACHELAESLDLPLHIHLAETVKETELCLARYSMRPVEWAIRNNLFDLPVIAAHLVDITDEEIDTLRQFNVVPVHNPASNMKLASGVSPVEQMLSLNIPVALGTDGPASNNNVNMFSEMKLAALLQKVYQNNPMALPAQKTLDMATLNGAKAMGDLGLGSIEPGKKADCIALDCSFPNLFPTVNPVSQIVYSAMGNECVMTMINGNIVYDNGKFTLFDYDSLLRELVNVRKFIAENG